MKIKRVYLAGPMTGIPQFNFPAFEAEATKLRAMGFEVTSPAEMDDEATRASALASKAGDLGDVQRHGTWGDFLARDVKLLTDGGIEAVVVLPGWEESKGARLETFVADLCGLHVLYRQGKALYFVAHSHLAAAWGGDCE